ncbi:MAG: HlyD family secretion protein [Candidatus Rokubacteria bacterium]|nr:HlyD family secretion protein [Candidatus Rokubacteria bacterium]
MNGIPGDRRRIVIGAAIVVGLGGLLFGGWAWWQARTQVSTDDAYVEGAVTVISSKVSGNISEMLLKDNQAVKAGELLLRVDPRDYRAKRDQAAAAVKVAEAALLAVRSELPMTRGVTVAQGDEARGALEGARAAEAASQSAVEEAQAQLEAKRAAASAAEADVAGARATAVQAVREKERQRKLVQQGLVAQRDYDQAEAAEGTARAALEAFERRKIQVEREAQQVEAALASRRLGVQQARQRVAELRGSLARAESQRHQVPMKEAEVARAEAALAQAQADLAYTELQLLYTEVRAPVDGVVSKRTVELGQVAQMGQPLLAIVPLHDVWVIANFKETQLARIRPGMKAEVHVDTFSDRTFQGTVDSLAAGTGARFSLLPPENATGNWVKVVQRLPVKIRLDPGQFANPDTLRAGLSAVVTVKLR